MKKNRKESGGKLLGVLLALAMIVGLFPGMSLTAYAADDPYASLLRCRYRNAAGKKLCWFITV